MIGVDDVERAVSARVLFFEIHEYVMVKMDGENLITGNSEILRKR